MPPGLRLAVEGWSMAGQEKLNILLIHPDQHRHDCLGYSSGGRGRTPNLDRLAAGAVRFEQAYTPIPVWSSGEAVLVVGIVGRAAPAAQAGGLDGSRSVGLCRRGACGEVCHPLAGPPGGSPACTARRTFRPGRASGTTWPAIPTSSGSSWSV